MATVSLKAESEQRSAVWSWAHDVRGFGFVRIALGLLLVIAAGLKLYGLNVAALPRVGWFATPQVQVAAAEWELVLGLWLLSGAWQIGAWLASIGTFLTFAAVSGYFGWIGVASCGCFGAIRTNPWVVFAVDLAAVLALLVFRPGARRASKDDDSHARASGANGDFFFATIPLGAAAILLALTGIGSWVYGSPASALAHVRGDLLTVEPSYVDFGRGKPGDVIERTITVYNWTDQPVRLIGGTSDSTCNVTDELPAILPALTSQPLRVFFRVPETEVGALARDAVIWTENFNGTYLGLKLYWRATK